MYTYVTEDDIKRMKQINSNKELNELFQEALEIHSQLLIEEHYYYKKVKGYKGWLLGKKEKDFSYTLFFESPGYDGSAYQARYIMAAGNNPSSISTYLYGIINGGNAVKERLQKSQS